MIDTNLIKSNPKKIFEDLKLKKYDLNIETFESLELS